MFCCWWILLCLVISVSGQVPIVAQSNDGWVCGLVTCAINETAMCFVTERSTDNETQIRRIGTCLDHQGNIIKDGNSNSTNDSKKHMDIVSMSIINMDLHNIPDLRNTLVAVLKSYIARTQYYPPYGPPPPPPFPPQYPYQDPRSQIIVIQPPTPQVVVTNGRVESEQRQFDNICNPPKCPTGPQDPNFYPNAANDQKYTLPNMQPPLLAEFYKLTDEIESRAKRIRELLKELSAGRGNGWTDQHRNFRDPFPVLVPPPPRFN